MDNFNFILTHTDFVLECRKMHQNFPGEHVMNSLGLKGHVLVLAQGLHIHFFLAKPLVTSLERTYIL